MACSACAKRRQAMQATAASRRTVRSNVGAKKPQVARATSATTVKSTALSSAFAARRQRLQQITRGK